MVMVISPLIGLMKDQVDKCIMCRIKAVAVTSEEKSKRCHEEDVVINGEFQLIYIGPEMLLGTRKWRSALESDLYQAQLRAVIIDKAHCVKKW